MALAVLAMLIFATPVHAGTTTITGTPSVGETLMASVTEVGTISDLTWKWARGDTETGPFTDITGATSSTYTVVDADVGKYLRATANYTQTITSTSYPNTFASDTVGPVAGSGSANAAPMFSAMTATRTLPENSVASVATP